MSRYIKIVDGRKQASDKIVELNSSNKIPLEYIPDSISGGGSVSVYAVDSLATRDALDPVYEGDVCFVEGSFTYIYDGTDWLQLSAAATGGTTTTNSDLDTHFWLSF